MVEKIQKVGVIGAGKVGTALAVLLSRRGYQVVSVYSRSVSSAQNLAKQVAGCKVADSAQQTADASQMTFITTPDGVIPVVAASIKWKPGMNVVHCSGADSTAILEPAKKAGAGAGAFHPLQTFAGAKEAIDNIPGTTFAIEAEEPLLAALKQMAADLGGNWITVNAEDKALYHASAVFVSNYMVTLVKMATDLWKTFSIPTDQAVKALLPLIKGTVHNIETLGIPNCLTGPIARGDSGTVEKHIDKLSKKAPQILEPYKMLGLNTIPIAEAKGTLKKEQARKLEEILAK